MRKGLPIICSAEDLLLNPLSAALLILLRLPGLPLAPRSPGVAKRKGGCIVAVSPLSDEALRTLRCLHQSRPVPLQHHVVVSHALPHACAVVQVFGPVGWRIPPPGFQWALPPIHAGDRLNFSSSPQGPVHSVYKMKDAAAWLVCNYTDSVFVGSGPVVIGRLPKSGRFYYAGQEQDCKRGQKVVINVLPRECAPVLPFPSPCTTSMRCRDAS